MYERSKTQWLLLIVKTLRNSNLAGLARCCALTLYLCATLCATSALGAPVNKSLQFNNYSVADGLSQVTVYDIEQDQYGFVWVGTQNGLNRFDSHKFRVFVGDLEAPETGPASSLVYSITKDPRSSDLWLGTAMGISRFQQNSQSFRHYPVIDASSGANQAVFEILFTRDGRAIAGTDTGLYLYDTSTGAWTRFALWANQAPRVDALVEDNLGRLWIGAASGLYLYASGALTKLFSDKIQNVLDLNFEPDGTLWVGTNGQGIAQINTSTLSPQLVANITRANNQLADDIVTSSLRIQDELWVATAGGLSIIDLAAEPKVNNFYHDPAILSSLPGNYTTKVFADNNGETWIGTWTSGLGILSQVQTKFNTILFGSDAYNRGISIDSQDNLWLANPEGVWRLANDGELYGPWQFAPDSPLAGLENSILHITHSSDEQTLWIASRRGLNKLDLTNPRYIEQVAFTDVPIYTVTQSAPDELWIGSRNTGLYQYNPLTDEIDSHWAMPLITKVLVPEQSDKILVTTLGGLYLVDKNSQQTQVFQGSHGQVTTWLSKASDNSYWLGTQAGGLDQVTVTDDFEITNIENTISPTALQGLSIAAVATDENNNLWMSTTRGIVKYKPEQGQLEFFETVTDENAAAYVIGFVDQDQQGGVYFGSTKGITYFQPSDIQKISNAPKLYFSELKVLNKTISSTDDGSGYALDAPIFLTKAISLEADQVIFSLEFSALNYANPDNHQYAYMLEGFDSSWNFTETNQRVLTYTNLDPGSYTLKLKSANTPDHWQDNTIALNITIAPAWWQTTWSKFLFAGLVLLLGYLFYYFRISALRTNARRLEQLVQDRTEELQAVVKQLQVLSSKDPLTGLSNRRDFQVKASTELKRFHRGSSTFAILLIDVDNFKSVNDKFGHAVGDQVLKCVAQTLAANVREQDTLARWGGEEFIAWRQIYPCYRPNPWRRSCVAACSPTVFMPTAATFT
jgi:ligand-binding sensor domain-containing protein